MADRLIDTTPESALDLRGTRRREPMPTARTDGRSVGELLRELSGEASALVREEITLAKTEMREKAGVYQRNMVSMAVGGGLLLAALLLLMAAINRGLTMLLEGWVGLEDAVWLAPLILAVVSAFIGYGMVKAAISAIRREGVTPHETVETLREDKNLVVRRVKS